MSVATARRDISVLSENVSARRSALVSASALLLLCAAVNVANAATQSAPARPAAEDPVFTEIKRVTNAFSDASSRNDQTAMGDLLDDDVLFSNGNGSVQRDTGRDKTDEVSAKLQQRTQAFLDAGQRGDIKAMGAYLDRAVVFVDENGRETGWSNFSGAALAAPPRGASSEINISDWVLRHTGDIAVTSFTGERVTRFGGQTLRAKFITVDAWVQRSGKWMLIESETIPLNQDPPVMSIPADQLSDYVGDYSSTPGAIIKISRDGDALTVSTSGAKPVVLVAEARDVFFTPGEAPGYPRSRIIFQRDAAGHITGCVSRVRGQGNLLRVKLDSGTSPPPPAAPAQGAPHSTLILRDFVVRHSGDVAVASFFHDKVTEVDGQTLKTTYRSTETWVKRGAGWKMITSQGRELQPDPPVAHLAPNALAAYAGAYSVAPGITIRISPSTNRLVFLAPGAKAVTLAAEAADVFFTPGAARNSLIFRRDALGRLTGGVFRRDEGDLAFNKAD